MIPVENNGIRYREPELDEFESSSTNIDRTYRKNLFSLGISDQRVPWVGGEALCFWKAELFANDVGPQHERHHLVGRVPAAHAFTAHTAVGADNETFCGDVLECEANEISHFVGRFDLERVMIDDADTHLTFQ